VINEHAKQQPMLVWEYNHYDLKEQYDMTIKKKILIVQMSGFFYCFLAVVLFMLPALINKSESTLTGWLSLKSRVIFAMIMIISYSILMLWAQDFFKKKWNRKDYTPICSIILATIVLIISLIRSY